MNQPKRVFVGLIFLPGLLLLAACSKQETAERTPPQSPLTNNTPSNSSGSRLVFNVKGVIQEVKPAENKIVIKHEEIPDFMPAMTMPFDVRDLNELSGLAPGQEVTFQMIVTEDDGWIENIKKTGQTAEIAERPSVRLVRDVEPLEEGMPLPNYTLTNSFGKPFQLADFKGKALAFSFIFTRCPFPLFCPKMNENLAAVHDQLLAEPNAPTNWHLISISFDPHFDTPSRLRSYSQRYKPNDEKWSFATGAMVEIDAITEQFGVDVAYQSGDFDHKLRTVVVDANGIIQRIFIGNEWKPDELLEEIKKAATVKPEPN